ncbi:hypothetical protein D3C85_1899290 [compost metagenome]
MEEARKYGFIMFSAVITPSQFIHDGLFGIELVVRKIIERLNRFDATDIRIPDVLFEKTDSRIIP